MKQNVRFQGGIYQHPAKYQFEQIKNGQLAAIIDFKFISLVYSTWIARPVL